jgi:hypothetical protein
MSALSELHSVRHDLHEPRERQKSSEAVLVPKALTEYGEVVASLIGLSDEMTRQFKELKRIEDLLRENGCTAPRHDFSAPMRAALSQWRGEGFWQR